MKRYSRGLVMGKMCPPHKGHQFLIQTALDQCDEVDVLITDTKLSPLDKFNIPVEKRVEWVARMFAHVPNVYVRAIPDLGIDDLQEYSHGYWADYTNALLGVVPDAVFSSEIYGKPWAEAMGAEHVLVDLERLQFHISGTMVRENSIKTIDLLPYPVRGYYMPRVVLVGAESSGTTTLALQLADHFNEPYVPEYGRQISERWAAERGSALTTEEWRDKDKFRLIMHTQDAIEDGAAHRADRLLVCDTDSFTTSLWWERYGESLMNWSELRDHGWKRLNLPNRFYIVTNTKGIPFTQDDFGTRDEGPHRFLMQQSFLRELKGQKIPHILVSGSVQERLERAIYTVNKWLDIAAPAMV